MRLQPSRALLLPNPPILDRDLYRPCRLMVGAQAFERSGKQFQQDTLGSSAAAMLRREDIGVSHTFARVAPCIVSSKRGVFLTQIIK